ncbi:DUF2235 domain-containing protein [Sphingomonas sp. GM_Shp_1]|uniref:phospholipase effector Tle1 domain-containing protein n=1 Tax=Sphingomonas sp. GM_Shp_1 TaxID=2937381 RepID=UPI00226BB95E|nr:DUF2235 domain-containing protein [Sphingomonas sp. GM_Shp_1]
MKRLVFCFDGTWNRLDADTPTNVVLTAASIIRQVPHGGPTQIIHYDEGVGTGTLDRVSGGTMGVGLVTNIREAYRFLIFNYDPGDEIFVFGFSRGAFSARTFCGFVRHVGPLRRLHAARIDDALKLYEARLRDEDGATEKLRRFRADYSGNVCIGADDDAWRCSNVPNYLTGQAPPLTIKYLGVWDTVGALGVPKVLPLSGMLNRKHRFHDIALTGFIENARHAVAIDEHRALFPAEPWGDLSAINEARNYRAEDPNAPYQEQWFPGTHGSVGGGGDIRGLSDGSLAWVLQGAKRAGLKLDVEQGSRIQAVRPDPLAPLVNVREQQFSATALLKTNRDGPSAPYQVSAAARRRWQAEANNLPEQMAYRPKTLAKVAAALDALPRRQPLASGSVVHEVVEKDTLRVLARHYLGSADLEDAIYEANLDQMDDPNEIFVGQKLRIPAPLPEQPADVSTPLAAERAP